MAFSSSQLSLSGTTVAVRISQTPGSRSSTTTWRPANFFPSEICPFEPTTFTVGVDLDEVAIVLWSFVLH